MNKMLPLLSLSIMIALPLTAAAGPEDTPLHKAVWAEDLALVHTLLADPTTNVNAQGRHDLTPLHVACHSGNLEIVKALLRAKADVDRPVTRGKETPLHIIISSCFTPEIVKALLSAKAAVNVAQINNLTPLHCACLMNHFEKVKILCSAPDIDLTIKTNAGQTAAEVAKAHNHQDITDYLEGFPFMRQGLQQARSAFLTCAFCKKQKGPLDLEKKGTAFMEQLDFALPINSNIIKHIFSYLTPQTCAYDAALVNTYYQMHVDAQKK